MAYLIFLVPFALVVLGMIASGDLRLTRRQQQKWEAQWQGLTAEEIERISRRYWGL